MFKRILKFSIVLIIFISFSSLFLSENFFIFDLISHFHMQYIIVLFLLSIIILFFREIGVGIGGLIYVIVISYIFIFPFEIFYKNSDSPDIFFMNTLYDNKNSQVVSDYILKIDAEVVALVEVNKKIKNDLQKIYGKPHVYHDYGGLSCAIFSKEKPQVSSLITTTTYPICISDFKGYSLVVIHPIPPLSLEYFNLQKRYFEEVKIILKRLSQENKKIVLVGDFNSTRYSALYRKYFGEYKEKNIYTWNSPSLRMLPIDHVLSLEPIDVSLAPSLSSDHHGLHIYFK